jgi:hypothetical protein
MISGKSFSELCRWVVDPRYPSRPQFHYTAASDGDWVFVNGDYIPELRRRFPLLATKRFVFVVHNTDRSFGSLELQTLLPRAIHIYAINTTVAHPHLTTIPLGFVDKQLPFLDGFKGGSSERDIEIYANFTITTNPQARAACAQVFNGDPRVVTRAALSVPEYYLDLCHSKFVLCPEGTGIDTHRVYEALFCGATPVVLRNSLAPLYARLPVCIVDTWTDPFVVPEPKRIDWSCKAFL